MIYLNLKYHAQLERPHNMNNKTDNYGKKKYTQVEMDMAICYQVDACVEAYKTYCLVNTMHESRAIIAELRKARAA